MYPCLVTAGTPKWFSSKPLKPFSPWGFSGGSVVNIKGEVVGNTLAGSETVLVGTPVQGIRRRFAELQIKAE